MKLTDSSSFRKAEKRAKKIAKTLKTPLLVLDLRREFKKRVVDYFLNGYKEGVTPNPCVVCNKEVKFGLLLEKALSLDADYIATGHYARKQEIENPEGAAVRPYGAGRKQKIEYKLLKAKDKNKDQSYFLWMLSQKQLKHILFPVGDYTKTQVRRMAKKFKLPVSNISESVEVCFIQKTINDFLEEYLKPKPGSIIDRKRKIIGRHKGLPFYTIGQRKGIGLPGGPYYVLDKDLKKNLLITTKNEKDLFKKGLIVKNVNWLRGKKPRLPFKATVKIRYRHYPALAAIRKNLKSAAYNLKFSRPQRAITPGQSAVFYRRDELLGGGVIC